MKNKRKLIILQLDTTLSKFKVLKDIFVPPKGWIRAIRDALGMNARQLADRLGEHRSWPEQIEKKELTGGVTIKTMRKVAECLDCVFVYGFVPKTSLEEIVKAQAKKISVKRLARASQTMSLESQALSSEENKKVLSDMVDELVDSLPSNLWDEI